MAKRSNLFRRKNQLVCDQSWIQTLIISVTSTLPWFVGYVLPALRSILCKLGPQFWQRVLQYFTQPVLFFLVNVVILSIWLTSRLSTVAFSDDTDALKEENHRLMWASEKDQSSSPVISSTQLDQLVSPPAPSPPALMITSPSILSYDQFTGIKTAVAVSAADSKIAASMEKRAAETYSQGKLLPDQSMADGSSGDDKIEATVDTERRLRATTSLKSAGEALKVKLERRRSSTLPRADSRVNMVRDPLVGRAIAVEGGLNRKDQKMELVMDKDELKERIDVFFAKFREQMRQESLRHYH